MCVENYSRSKVGDQVGRIVVEISGYFYSMNQLGGSSGLVKILSNSWGGCVTNLDNIPKQQDIKIINIQTNKK